MSKYGIVILAAGNSSRLGRPKQLLELNGSTFIAHIVQQASDVAEATTMVVSGAADQEIRTALAAFDVQVCFNPDWAQGMSTSIRSGVRALLHAEPAIEACMLVVCDQPYVSTGLFWEMVSRYESAATGILACSYGGTVGSPAIFGKQFFDELMNLEGQEGAKKIIKKYQTNVLTFPFPKGLVDIDTAEDYVTFMSGQQDQIIDAGKGN
jgi:molybdenum cofactor cytidylyltransferase